MHPQHVSSGTNIYQKLLILKCCVHYAYILMKFSVGRHSEQTYDFLARAKFYENHSRMRPYRRKYRKFQILTIVGP